MPCEHELMRRRAERLDADIEAMQAQLAALLAERAVVVAKLSTHSR